MKPPQILCPDGTPIRAWAEWTRPKRGYQWKCGRSAMELARAWFPGDILTVPSESESVLLSHSRLEGLELIRAIPELVTALPERGEGRNHDLWILGKTPAESVTICIEAKADEPFGNYTVAEYREVALKRRRSGVSTRAPERIEALLKMVEGDTQAWEPVRYQLLAALCGTILQAKADSSQLAVFLVHEFHTDKTDDDKLGRNKDDFELFLDVLGLDPASEGHLTGPVLVNGVECLVGKVVRR